MNNLEIFCVTNKNLSHLKKTNYKLAGVGKERFPNEYIRSDTEKNIFYKEKNYSELVFHYWFWKNKLKDYSSETWIGFCQKRRFWLGDRTKKQIHNNEEFFNILLKNVPKEWENYNSIICEPINVSNPKKIKMIKRGWKNILLDPSIFFMNKKQTIELHFDMHHGYKVLDKAINVMALRDRKEFKKFVSTQVTFNPHIMFISKKDILEKWFHDLFEWLFKCEEIFGFENLKGYDQERLYAYLSERYLSFWFKKYTKTLEWPWIFYENN
jgi:hypothetical protein